MPEEFFQKALHCQKVAGVGRESPEIRFGLRNPRKKENKKTKLRFRKNFDGNFSAVERVTSTALILKCLER